MNTVASTPAVVDVPSVQAVQLICRAAPGHSAISTAMQDGFQKLGRFLGECRLTPAGPPRAIYTAWGPEGTTFTLAFPIAAAAPSAPASASDIHIGPLPATRAWRFTHHGSYDSLEETYKQVGEWLKSQGLMTSDADWVKFSPMWEEYLTQPGATPAAEQVTHIYVPRP